MAVNHASRRVLEKIGLNYVRTVHVDWPDRFPGIKKGEVQYELMGSGWMGGKGSTGILEAEKAARENGLPQPTHNCNLAWRGAINPDVDITGAHRDTVCWHHVLRARGKDEY